MTLVPKVFLGPAASPHWSEVNGELIRDAKFSGSTLNLSESVILGLGGVSGEGTAIWLLTKPPR